ncbi:phenylalanine--tRNA ligase subunit beta [Patescibacteria group bacterium]|nr:phenylalanine--tRNA ligase subunit beta [Patescibacteria group bacterium]MCL5733529.1 phenylalanine--tRNA ligase subunit beta [Patescibacteria group bacterium]
MKFSYALIKQLLPKVPPQAKLIQELNLKSFEAEGGGKNLEIAVSPNRFSDAASHWGIAKEAAAVFDLKIPPLKSEIINPPSGKGFLKISVKDPSLCSRYEARYFEINEKAFRPLNKKIKGFLADCGINSINPVVDAMNYVMIEVGQPLHAFDADKLEKNSRGGCEIVVRRAKNKEKIKTLDNQNINLDEEALAIADLKKPLAIAGIKGGKEAEITAKTKRIVVEAANFDGANIFKTSKRIRLQTDASLRFAHNLSPDLAGLGMDRVTILLKEMGVKLVDSASFYPKPVSRELIEFNVEKLRKFIGVDLGPPAVIKYLERLGFTIKTISKKTPGVFLVEPPVLRTDISNFADLAEEVARLYGYNSLRAAPPVVQLGSAKEDDIVMFKEEIRRILTGLSIDEIYNYSFISKKEAISVMPEKVLEFLKNPISEQFEVLRPELKPGLVKNFEDNSRFFERFQSFEIGKVFYAGTGGSLAEKWNLGIVLAAKKENRFLELKGIIDELFKKIGIIDYFFNETPNGLRIEADGLVLGELINISGGKGFLAATAEIEDLERLMNLMEGEKEFEPFPKYPAIIRDLSFLIDKQFRIGNILMDISEYDLSNIENVDLIDEYTDEDMKEDMRSLTFRLVFRSDSRTLSDKEVDEKISGIKKILEEKYGVIFR